MPEDRSLFHYGAIYHMLLDPLITPARRAIVEYIPPSSKVLDIGCGTGQLCFELSREKHCQVMGIDLSRRMLDFAEKHNRYASVEFRHMDASHMPDIDSDSFDYVVMSYIIHELYRDSQLQLLSEAWRVGRHVLMLDSNAPLPRNPFGIAKRIVEYIFGRDHFAQFRAYLASGGIGGILDDAQLPSTMLTAANDLAISEYGILDDAQLRSTIVYDKVFSASSLRLVVLGHNDVA
jgi:SAM-dependent methyltransferase